MPSDWKTAEAPFCESVFDRADRLDDSLKLAHANVVKLGVMINERDAEIARLSIDLEHAEAKRAMHKAERDDADAANVKLNTQLTALREALREAVGALNAMLSHSCVSDTDPDDKFVEDHDAERLARTAIARIAPLLEGTGGGWLPIETAPKDGGEIYLWGRYKDGGVALSVRIGKFDTYLGRSEWIVDGLPFDAIKWHRDTRPAAPNVVPPYTDDAGR